MPTEANDTDGDGPGLDGTETGAITGTTTGGPVITDAEDRQRFEARVDGELAGILTYRRSEGRVVYPHTEVQPAFEGRGIGGELTRAALEDARSRHLRVNPACPFIAAWIRKNPEYEDLVG